jgi:hypothetical protein
MNKHIELVKKWLADKDSVSQEELEVNVDAACDAYTDDAYDAESAYYAAYADYYSYYAANAAYAGDDSSAAYWVKRYEELSK